MLTNLKYKLFLRFLQKKGNYLSKKQAKNTNSGCDFDIDFVVTWVKGDDPVWRSEKKKYEPEAGYSLTQMDNGDARYRDWNLFMYWFRAVEKYAPWVRNVYLVTCGHVPQWINDHYPKLKVVFHSDFIPQEYLPTFNSNVIELNLHRIPGLSEHFVYFNDDIVLTAPVTPSDFFEDGKPRYCAIAQPLRNNRTNEAYLHTHFSNLGLVNEIFKGKISTAIQAHPENWFSYQYGLRSKVNIDTYDKDYFWGMYVSHMAYPCIRSTMESVWKDAYAEMNEMSHHRFRTARDYTLHIVAFWDMVNGNFMPIPEGYYGKYFVCLPINIVEISDAILSKKYKMICLNDTPTVSYEEFLSVRSQLANIFEKVLPDKSEFEK